MSRRTIDASRVRASSRRDAGLRLASQISRWTAAGAIALTGLVSVVARSSFHGRSVTAASSQPAQSSSPSSSSGSSSGESGSGLQQPAQAPASSAPQVAPTPVVSGGS